MPRTIMIGASDANTAYLLRRYVEESGFQAVPVSQSETLPDLAAQAQPALIILEIALGDSKGWDVMRRLKAVSATRGVPIVVYSCLEQPPGDWREGVDGFLLQSARYDDFVTVLKQVVSEQSSTEEERIG